MKQINNSDLYIISENEIQFKNKSSERPRSVCPVCSSNRGNPNDPSVAWNISSGVGYCHHCGARFKIDNNPNNFEQRYGQRPKDEVADDFRLHLLPIEPETEMYLEARGISKTTALAAGICSRQSWAGASWLHWVAFPFYLQGKVVNVQYKMADTQQKEFMFERGGRMIPWNIDCIADADGSEPLYITEGMMDALALMECGIRFVVSVPNGAGSRMDCFDEFKDNIMRRFPYIVFAGDTDSKGIELREKMLKYFEHSDICAVSWQYNGNTAKDADEMLMVCGADGVRESLKNAEKAADGLMTAAGDDEASLHNLLVAGMPQGKTIGLKGFDDLVHFEEGNLLLVTGYPGSGKSTLVNYITMRLLVMFNWKTLFFSPEKMPQKYHEAELMSIIEGKPFDYSVMTDNDFRHGRSILRNNVFFMNEEVDEVEQIIRIAQRAVRVMGIKVLVIDPFVYLSIPAIPGATETQKIAEMLKKLMLATRRLNIMTILVAHPRKPSTEGPSEPSLYEVSGSANFYNFCDAGIIMERVKGSDCVVRITCGKARRPFNGAMGVCQLAFDTMCGRYVSCIRDDKGRYTTSYGLFDLTQWTLKNSLYKETTIYFDDTLSDKSTTEYIDPGDQNIK